MTFPVPEFMKAWRAVRDADGRRISPAEYELVMAAIEGKWTPPAAASDNEPPWLSYARTLIGLKEVPGPKHNSRIVQWWHDAGATWFNDDETPWCGNFVQHVLTHAGIKGLPASQFARAKAWLSWGKATPPRLGCIGVFTRDGGGHVGFLVGESASSYYVFGGNQRNAVNIMPVAKARHAGNRWPASLPLSTSFLPTMRGGIVSTNEA